MSVFSKIKYNWIIDSIESFATDRLLLDHLLDSCLFENVSLDFLAKRGHLNLVQRITEKNDVRFSVSAQGNASF